MRRFAPLLELLALTPSRNRKLTALADYFAATPDPDRGYALAALTGELDFAHIKPARLKEIALGQVDPALFAMSYDYVGDLGETIALIWPHQGEDDAPPLPTLAELIVLFESTPRDEISEVIASLLTRARIEERWALVKLATGGLRVGVSARLARAALALMSGKDLQEIEEVWHGVRLPYGPLFAWLEGRGDKPGVDPLARFHPMMLSHPVDEARDFERLDPADFSAEWKWDGIRVQLAMGRDGVSLYSRTGDDILMAFPEFGDAFGEAVIDGELLVGPEFDPQPFNALQQRLNRKAATPRLMRESPAFIRAYDLLFAGGVDLRPLPWTERRQRLEALLAPGHARIDLSPTIGFSDWAELEAIRLEGADVHGHEGVMIKRKSSPYVPGRPMGLWYKWKRAPNLVDAVLMYAQRGHGKRSSYYSDYTFGVWKGETLVPIGKAYSGFTDVELRKLDKWVRNHTIQAFGPVREVAKEVVFEIAFDSAHQSGRHKSGIALRFPRINRIRWDKPAAEAARIEEMEAFLP